MVEICDGCAQPEHCKVNGCFAEKARGVSFGSVPGGTRNASKVVRNPPKPEQPSWEKGRAGETRPGGGFMPYFNGDHKAMGVKEWGEQRSKLEPIRRHQVSGN